MLIDKVCGISEMELNLKNENCAPKSKLKKESKMINQVGIFNQYLNNRLRGRNTNER